MTFATLDATSQLVYVSGRALTPRQVLEMFVKPLAWRAPTGVIEDGWYYVNYKGSATIRVEHCSGTSHFGFGLERIAGPIPQALLSLNT